MKLLILNGNPVDQPAAFDEYLGKLGGLLESRGHGVTELRLRDLDIKHCLGCFKCWCKTPGECVIRDDSPDICRQYINSDLVIFASPLVMGFTSALLKHAHDRFVPLIMPYIRLLDNEVHHVARYPKYPDMALLVAREDDTDGLDIEIVTEIYRRDAINFMADLHFARTIDEPVEEIADAIDSI